MPVRLFGTKLLGISALFSSIFYITEGRKKITLKPFRNFKSNEKTYTTIELVRMHSEELHQHFEKILNRELEEHLITMNEGNRNKLKRIIHNFKLMKGLKNISTQVYKINKVIRFYLNITNDFIYNENTNISGLTVNFDELIEEIIKIENVKMDFISKREKNYFINSLFDRYLDTVLRIFSNMIIINKNHSGSLLNEKNLNYILTFCKDIVKENKNDSKSYLAKRVLLNYYTDENYYYTDCLVELNKRENFEDLVYRVGDIKTDKQYDYDIIFIHGLNVSLYL
jgi:hypothetical protein